jgi:hypothetical protein
MEYDREDGFPQVGRRLKGIDPSFCRRAGTTALRRIEFNQVGVGAAVGDETILGVQGRCGGKHEHGDEFMWNEGHKK